VQKLRAIIVNNAALNNVLCRTIEAYYKDKEEKEWLINDWRIRCINYIINLVVQVFLFINVIDLDELKLYDLEDADGELIDEKIIRVKFRLLESFGQGYNIVIYIRESSACTDYFRKLVGRIILIDNCTR